MNNDLGLVDIGTLRRKLFTENPSAWNGWVRDTTAAIEQDGGMCSEPQMMLRIIGYAKHLSFVNEFQRNVCTFGEKTL